GVVAAWRDLQVTRREAAGLLAAAEARGEPAERLGRRRVAGDGAAKVLDRALTALDRDVCEQEMRSRAPRVQRERLVGQADDGIEVTALELKPPSSHGEPRPDLRPVGLRPFGRRVDRPARTAKVATAHGDQ